MLALILDSWKIHIPWRTSFIMNSITRGFNVDVGVVTVQKRDSDGKMTRKQLGSGFYMQ